VCVVSAKTGTPSSVFDPAAIREHARFQRQRSRFMRRRAADQREGVDAERFVRLLHELEERDLRELEDVRPTLRLVLGDG